MSRSQLTDGAAACPVVGCFSITLEDAKEVHSGLRRAAGLVKAAHDRYIGG